MFDARRVAAAAASVVALSFVASIGLVVADAPVWIFYVVSAFLSGAAGFQILMPGHGLRFVRPRLQRRRRARPHGA